jgi:anti-sigma factor RsiW
MSHPEQDSPQDLAAAYALGALSPEEARRFEAYLAGSPEAQREVAEYREVAALLALAGPESVPAPDLRDRVLGGGRGVGPPP